MKLQPITNKILFILHNSTMKKYFAYVLSIFIILTASGIYRVFRVDYQTTYSEMLLAADNIEEYLNTVYNSTTQLTNHIGKIIANGDYQNSQWVAQQLKNFNYASTENYGNNITWPPVSWVNKDQILVANQACGVLSNTIYVNGEYIKRGRLKPWELVITPPKHSLINGNFVIPAGIGVTDKNNNFIGFIGVGFDIEALITSALKGNPAHIKFIICDDQGNLYLASESSLLKKFRNMKDFGVTTIHSNGMIKGFYIENNGYFYHKNISRIPGFSIFVGYNKYRFFSNLCLDILMVVMAFILVIAICSILILYTTSMVMHTIGIVEELKKKFINEISENVTQKTKSSLERCNRIRDLIQDMPSDTKNSFLKTLDVLENSIKLLEINTADKVERQDVELNQIIIESIAIIQNDLFLKNIKIKLELPNSLPKILGDPLHIKQIIVGIISFIIDSSVKNTYIKITTYSKIINSTQEVFLVFQDISFVTPQKESINQPKQVDLRHILELILLNNGQCNIKHRHPAGSAIQIKFIGKNEVDMSNVTILSDYKKNKNLH